MDGSFAARELLIIVGEVGWASVALPSADAVAAAARPIAARAALERNSARRVEFVVVDEVWAGPFVRVACLEQGIAHLEAPATRRKRRPAQGENTMCCAFE